MEIPGLVLQAELGHGCMHPPDGSNSSEPLPVVEAAGTEQDQCASGVRAANIVAAGVAAPVGLALVGLAPVGLAPVGLEPVGADVFDAGALAVAADGATQEPAGTLRAAVGRTVVLVKPWPFVAWAVTQRW
jgi:hypothetical protein